MADIGSVSTVELANVGSVAGVNIANIGSIDGANAAALPCSSWGDDVTDETLAIGNENPSYIGSAYDDVLDVGDAGGSWYCYTTTYINHGWTGQNFTSIGAKTISKYRIYTHLGVRSYDPKDWTFEASNTGAWAGEEVILDTQVNQAFVVDTWQDYEFENNTSYNYYRLNVSANNGHATYLIITEIEMRECV